MKKILCLSLLLLFCAASYASNKACSGIPRIYQIKEIKAFPHSKAGTKVRVLGQFMGWKSKLPPPITKSDWVVKDDTGEIYVVGRLPGKLSPIDKNHIGKKVVVIGIVSETKKHKNAKIFYLKEISAYAL